MRREIKIQDGLLFGWLKERASLTFHLMTGKTLSGYVARFDRYCIVVQLETGQEVLLYKHALACVSGTGKRSGQRLPPPASLRDRRTAQGRR